MTHIPLGLVDLPMPKSKKLLLNSEYLIGLSLHIWKANPKLENLVTTLKEIRDSKNEQCRSVKLMVVGDAAAGKTTLLTFLRGENVKGMSSPLLATDGIDLGELVLEDVRLSCWDFAGQVTVF